MEPSDEMLTTSGGLGLYFSLVIVLRFVCACAIAQCAKRSGIDRATPIGVARALVLNKHAKHNRSSVSRFAMNCKWLVLVIELSVFLVVHYCTKGETRLTVTPAGATCPGIDMVFTCHQTSESETTVSNVRWKLIRSGTDLVPGLALTQGQGCSHWYNYYNNLPIVVTLYDSYSTLNITADNQLNGLMVECLLVLSDGRVERESLQIQITRKSIKVMQCKFYRIAYMHV